MSNKTTLICRILGLLHCRGIPNHTPMDIHGVNCIASMGLEKSSTTRSLISMVGLPSSQYIGLPSTQYFHPIGSSLVIHITHKELSDFDE